MVLPTITFTLVFFPHLGQIKYPLTFTFTVTSCDVEFVAEQAGLEPTPPISARNGLAIRRSTCYAYCSVLVGQARLELAMSKEPDLQSGAIPITLYCPVWRKVEDSNPQETIADLHAGFLDRCDSRYTNLPYSVIPPNDPRYSKPAV